MAKLKGNWTAKFNTTVITKMRSKEKKLILNKKEKKYLKVPLKYLLKTSLHKESVIPIELLNIKFEYLLENYQVAVDDKFVDSLDSISTFYSYLGSIPQKDKTMVTMMNYRLVPEDFTFYTKSVEDSASQNLPANPVDL